MPKGPDKNNQQGFTVLLAVLIMSSLTIVTFTAADIIMRTGQSSKKIGESEIAYYAAETAIEKALYKIEKDRTIVNLSGVNGTLDDIDNADWSRTIEIIEASSNPYSVNVLAGESYQLDLDFNGITLPTGFIINWTGSATVIAHDSENSTQIEDTSSPITVPFGGASRLILRINNTDTQAINFSFSALPFSYRLPLGIRVIGTGNYQGQERTIEVERMNHQTY